MKEKQKETEKGKAGTVPGYKPRSRTGWGLLLPHSLSPVTATLKHIRRHFDACISQLCGSPYQAGIAREGLQQPVKSILPERPLRKYEPVSRCSTAFK